VKNPDVNFMRVLKLPLLLSLALAVCALQTARATSTEPADGSKPNIVFIFADDLGRGDVGAYGGKEILTPHIDALALSGVQFNQAYVTHPVCSPSRAGLMTGRYQQRHGWEFNPAGRDVSGGMAADQITLADMLSREGYRTGLIGKWHLGYEPPHDPLSRGFDEYFGVLAGGSIFIDPQAPGVESVGSVRRSRDTRISVYDGRHRVDVDNYLTDVFTQKALEFIQTEADAPFFLFLSHTTPHTPLQATTKYLDRYRHIREPARRIYAAMVASLDDSVGAVVDALKQTGQLDNTLLIFSSDNGCAAYISVCSNAPFAGFKRYHQEGGIRVPLLISWPKQLAGGNQYEPKVSLLDLMATFASVSGSAHKTEDSVDLLPYLKGAAGRPHDYLYWRSGPTLAIRDDRWKLIVYNRSPLNLGDLREDGRLKPPEQGWPRTSPHGQLQLLYDLVHDPGETRNLADRHPDIVRRLREQHAAWNQGLPQQALSPAIRSTLADMHGKTVQLIF
jgi:arylsulfatase A-like enzyme